MLRVYPSDINLEFLFGGDGRWSQEFDEEIADFDAVSPAWDKEVGEVGDFDAEVDADGDMNDAVAAAHDGATGLEFTVDDGNAMYGTMNMAAINQTSAVATYWINMNDASVANIGQIWNVLAQDGAAASTFLIIVVLVGADWLLQSFYYDDTPAIQQVGSNYTLPSGWNRIDIFWSASTAPAADDGFMYIFVNGVLVQSGTGLDNDTHDIDIIHFGGVIMPAGPHSGSFYMDTIKIDPVGAPFVDKLAVKNRTYGLAVPIIDGTERYGEFTDPTAETTLTSEKWFNPNTITMAENDAFDIMYSPGEWAVSLVKSATAYTVKLTVDLDSGSSITSAYEITDAFHLIRAVVVSSSGVGNDDGYGQLFIDGVLKEELTGLDNDTKSTGEIRYGSRNTDSGTFGVVYFDDCRWMSSAWIDRFSDVIANNKLKASYGIKGFLPTMRVATTGKMSFQLNNGENNSQNKLGLYSPGHTNAQSGFEIGTPVLLKIVNDGIAYYKFYGTIREITPIAGKHGKRVTQIAVVDFQADMAEHKMDLLAVSTNQVSSEVASSIVGNMARQPYSQNISTGQSTFAFAADGLKDEKTTALAAMQRVAISEFGYQYTIGDTNGGGQFRFEDRNARTTNLTIMAALSEDELSEISLIRSDKSLFNRIEAKTFPRSVGAGNEVLYSLPNPISIGPGETETIIARYRDPDQEAARISGTSMVTPIADTDFKFGSTEGGGANDMNGDLGIVATFGANSAQLDLTNNAGSSGWLNLMQLRGIAIRLFDPATALALDGTSQLAYGTRQLNFSMLYQDNPLEGQDFADTLLSRWKDPRTLPKTAGFWANQDAERMIDSLEVEPGSRVALSESVSAIADDYFVNGVDLEIWPTKNIFCRWFIVPASSSAFWFLGEAGSSEIGQTTVLGF